MLSTDLSHSARGDTQRTLFVKVSKSECFENTTEGSCLLLLNNGNFQILTNQVFN